MRKILSFILVFVMLLSVSIPASAEEDYATIIFGDEEYRVKVGGTFEIKKSLTLPEGYSVAYMEFFLSYDNAGGIIEPMLDDVYVYYTTDLKHNNNLGAISVSDYENCLTSVFAAPQYNEGNYLTNGKDNAVTLIFNVLKPGNITITERLSLALFSENNPMDAFQVIQQNKTVADWEDLADEITNNTVCAAYDQIDLPALERALYAASELDPYKYTLESYLAVYDAVMEAADLLLNSGDSITASEVDKATKAINDAIAALKAAESIFNYSLSDDGTFEITEYTGSDKNVLVPSEIDGIPVTKIGEKAFEECTELENIYLPESVTYIGAYAFSGCTSLLYAEITGEVTAINDYTFAGCGSLLGVLIPPSVVSISPTAFDAVSPELTIFAESGSYAEQFAKENGIEFAEVLFIDIGDVNGDGAITSLDATFILQRAAGIIAPDEENYYDSVADVNFDGNVTSLDATLVLQFAAGIIQEF